MDDATALKHLKDALPAPPDVVRESDEGVSFYYHRGPRRAWVEFGHARMIGLLLSQDGRHIAEEYDASPESLAKLTARLTEFVERG